MISPTEKVTGGPVATSAPTEEEPLPTAHATVPANQLKSTDALHLMRNEQQHFELKPNGKIPVKVKPSNLI